MQSSNNKMPSLILTSFLLSLPPLALGTTDPYSSGPYHVRSVSFSSSDLSPALERNVDVWAPNVEGTFPLLFFQGGSGGSWRIYQFKAGHL